MSPEVRQALIARLAVARVTKGKAKAVLARVSADGRLRGMLAYWGAHTGRWAGRGFQPQNLTRPIPSIDYEEVHRALSRILAGELVGGDRVAEATQYLQLVCGEHGCSMGALLSSLLRGVIISATGQLASVDYSAIEARVLLWLAGDEEGLEVYRRFDAEGGPDPYMHAASAIYGVEPGEIDKAQRAVGKVVVLACGYGGSVAAFDAMAGAYGVDTSALEVRGIVDAWRDSRPLVAGERTGGGFFTEPEDDEEPEWIITRRGGLWKALTKVVWEVVAGDALGTHEAGRCTWSMAGGHLICTLPSGRPLVYREAKIEERDTQYGRREVITFAGRLSGRSGWHRVATYGGRLAENVTQAAARDLLADAIVRLEGVPGVQVVLTVHDEILAEVHDEEGLRAIERVMLDPPAWAEGLPVAVDGHVRERYGK